VSRREEGPFSGTWPSGAATPLAPLQHDRQASSTQASCRTPRPRRCLLKGCERLFQPCCPQARYCSRTCQEKARRWREWRASRIWRQTEAGRQCRREQSRQYRQRVRARREAEQAAGLVDEAEQPADLVDEAEREAEQPADLAADLADEGAREGQRPAWAAEKCACARPGCYELFVPSPRSPRQRFCSPMCRNALRRVLQREARWGLRRKSTPRGRRWIPP